MTKYKNHLIPLLCIVSPLLQANPQQSQEPGWSYDLGIFMGYADSNSQLDTDDDNQITESLDESGTEVSSGFIYPDITVTYTQSNLKTQWFLGTSSNHISSSTLQYELGVAHKFQGGPRVELGYFPEALSSNEVWSDPYLVDTARESTDETHQGFRLTLSNLFGTRLSMNYAYSEREIDEELSGEGLGLSEAEQLQLVRDGRNQRLELAMGVPLSRSLILKPSLEYSRYRSDGEANRNHDYQLGMSVINLWGRHTLVATANIGQSEYDAINPVFDQKADAQTGSFQTVYSYAKPFGWQRAAFTLILGYGEKDSDIDFFDNYGAYSIMGVSFKL